MLQLLLGAAIAGAGFVGVYWPGSVESFFGVLGLLLAVVGALLVLLGVLSLDALQTSVGSELAMKLRDAEARLLIRVSTAELECLLATLIDVGRRGDEAFVTLRREAVREFLDRPRM